MSKYRLRRQQRDTLAALQVAEPGIVVGDITPGGRHMMVTLEYKGRTITQPISTSGGHGPKNWIAQVRRAFGIKCQ